MATTHWSELREQELRYLDHTWRLTGEVTVRNQGEVLALEARQADGVRHRTASLCFGVEGTLDSLNPGEMGEHFDRIERNADSYHLYVKDEPRTYRYVLHRLEQS